jgi:hypothetical protein
MEEFKASRSAIYYRQGVLAILFLKQMSKLFLISAFPRI